MKFTILQAKDNRLVMNVYYSNKKIDLYAFTEEERMKMFAIIDKLLGEEPEPEIEEPAKPPQEN